MPVEPRDIQSGPEPELARRMVTVDKVAGMGEVVTYATVDNAKLAALAQAAPRDITYEATWEVLEKATSYECVRVVRSKRRGLLDTFTTEWQARAYVRGMVKVAELLAPKLANGKRGRS